MRKTAAIDVEHKCQLHNIEVEVEFSLCACRRVGVVLNSFRDQQILYYLNSE